MSDQVTTVPSGAKDLHALGDPSTLPQHPGIYGSAVVGELSRADIHALANLARGATRILEFGCGGSTLAFAQFAAPSARIVSVETEPKWVDVTREKLARVQCERRVEFLPYNEWKARLEAQWAWFDLVFVDGLETERPRFAEDSWRMLQPGGVQAWHDCRWPQIVTGALQHVANHFQEVDVVQIGAGLRSNVMTISKRVEVPEHNDPDRGRTDDWMSAHAELPKGWPVR